jgi:uncharacterized protein
MFGLFKKFGTRNLANRGDAIAQCLLGISYAKGDGVPQNFTEAVKWFRKAADQGNADAQHNLGLYYALGWDGVAPDNAESVKWY